MRTVIQRVLSASVLIGDIIKSQIKEGLLVLVGIEDSDICEDVEWLAKKICHMRIFNDENGIMNKSILEVEGDILVVSQFTLYASTKKGNRPSYIRASKSNLAILMYDFFCKEISMYLQKEIKTGEFGAEMKVNLVNDGPVTIIIDSKNKE